ncbi:MAG: hypothetical protein D6782_06600, partial [Alphaproteobacteria bacterium]
MTESELLPPSREGEEDAAASARRASDAPSALAVCYRRTRARSLAIAAPLAVEDQVAQSMTDASPTKWHLAHTTWFFETFLLKPYAPGYMPFDAAYAYLFNSYYEAVGAQYPRARRGLLTRPTLARVHDYRAYVDDAMADLIAGADMAADPARLSFLVRLGLNHEEQHQELMLTDVKHLLAHNPLAPAPYGRR